MGDGTLKEYDLKEEKPTATELFKFPMGGDGLAIDSESNLYAALGDNTVRVMDIEGNEKQVLYFDARPTSITFGGEDMKTVLITTETKVFTIPANVEGVQLEEVQKKRDADLNEEEELPLLEEEELADLDVTEEEELPDLDVIEEKEELPLLKEEELEDLDVTEEELLPLEVRDGDVLEEEELEDLDIIEEEEELPLLKEEELEDLDVIEEEEELPLKGLDIEEKEDLIEEEDLKVAQRKPMNKKTNATKKNTQRKNNAAHFNTLSESEHEVTMMAGAGRGNRGKNNNSGKASETNNSTAGRGNLRGEN